MPAPLSIVITTFNAASTLPATLACLIEGLEAGLIRDLVVSDGGSTDATRQIAEDVGAQFVSGAKGRGVQLDNGRSFAEGDWILFLHADTRLSVGWAATVLAHIAGSSHAAHFQLAFDAPGPWARIFASGANFRSRLGLPYGDQGLLISSALFDELGGFGTLPLMEDVAMVQKLKGKLTMLPVVALTSAQQYQEKGWIRRGVSNLWTLIRYLLGTDPAKLAKQYYR